MSLKTKQKMSMEYPRGKGYFFKLLALSNHNYKDIQGTVMS